MSQMFQLRTWLLDTEPEVWRRLVVDPRLSLEQLHTVMQTAFGWTNSHLHQFHEQDGRRYGTPRAFDTDVIDERKTLLRTVFDKRKKRIAYEYDFGDSWMHAVEFEKMVESETIEYPVASFIQGGKGVFSGKQRAAMCVAGERNGPPEDCGGLPGFMEALKLKSRAKGKKLSADERHTLEWLGEWEPEWFDLSTTNQYLGKVRVKKAFADC